jgi:signal transduction histidine kinase
VYGDKERTSQVLTNLLVNAIKYSPGANQVIVKVKEEKGVVVCSVEDFGMGITEEEHNKVFEKFYRSKRENLNTFPGLGMGLYISSEIIKRQNGKMWLESERGKGSIFYFSLPVAVEERVNVPVI